MRRPAAIVHIDWTRCEGRGLCIELLPQHLEQDEFGYPLVTDRPAEDRSQIAIAASEWEDAQEAVVRCPRAALRVVPG
ncbi:ferredoxin [Psychromicrobium xiongbiense]|uniref:ferredoxin n=1 Tax=Psychromicrobium xiongbiense TaxID=3051184 RepID=UPI002554F221|nr:ferredoxin [Psychromicrobium sp. YIM S02556]